MAAYESFLNHLQTLELGFEHLVDICVHFRRSQYKIDSRLLEAPFYEHFRQKTPSIEFLISPDMEQNVQESQQALLKDLHKRHLVCRVLAPASMPLLHILSNGTLRTLLICLCPAQMLRVPFLAAGQELLLMSSKTDTGMYGYLEKTGIIESLVTQEYKSFIGRSPPQMVCST